MTMDMSNIVVDVKEKVIQHNDARIAFEDVGIDLTGIWLDYTIADTYDKADGKFGSVWGNVALVDCHYVFDNLLDKVLVDSLPLIITDFEKWKAIRDMVNEVRAFNDYYNVTLCGYAYELDGVLKNQADYYLGDQDKIVGGVDTMGTVIIDELTWGTNLTMTAPLSKQFKQTSNMKTFLNSTLITIIVFLSMLSAMLLYSLMLSDVDAKTYEYGMLRALGFKSSHLMGMISMQSLLFSLPGLFFGVIIAFSLNLLMREGIFIASSNAGSYQLTFWSVVLGIIFGLFMPQLANYLPIKAALGKNLRSSLDLNRRNKDQIGVKMQRLEDVGMDINQFIVAVMLVVIGFSTYYVIPMAFFKQEQILLFVLLNLLLILIIIGLTFLCVLVFEYLESALLWLFLHTCCHRDKRVYTIIVKNMDGHR